MIGYSANANPPCAAFVGDSLSAAVGGYVDILKTRIGSSRVMNHAVGGTTTTSMLTTTNAIINYGYRWLNILGGVNDLGLANAATATITGNIDAMVTAALAAGMKVSLVSIAPWGASGYWNSTLQSRMEAVNSHLLAAAAGDPTRIKYVDIYSLLVSVGSPPNLAAANDVGDGVHWTEAGHTIVANAVGAVLFT